jgi:hypothetical protein
MKRWPLVIVGVLVVAGLSTIIALESGSMVSPVMPDASRPSVAQPGDGFKRRAPPTTQKQALNRAQSSAQIAETKRLANARAAHASKTSIYAAFRQWREKSDASDLPRDFGAALIACTDARRLLEQRIEPTYGNAHRRPPNLATVEYLHAHCSAVWNEFPSLDAMERMIEARFEIDASTTPSAEVVLAKNLAVIKPDQYSAADLRDGLNANQTLDIRAEMAIFALRSLRGLRGVDWSEFNRTMSDTRIAMFGYLLAAKFGCGESGACTPGSPMLIALCAAPEAGIYCQIPANLGQIARDSLTAREFVLWQSIEVDE